jgi:Transposase DDE domain
MPILSAYFSGEEILACEEAGITVYLPKLITSGINAKGRFGKQDFYLVADDVYFCPAGEQLTYRYTNEEDGKTLRRYWTTACQACALKSKCTTGKERPNGRTSAVLYLHGLCLLLWDRHA